MPDTPGEFHLAITDRRGDVTAVRAVGIAAGLNAAGDVIVRFGSANPPGRSFVDVALPPEAVAGLISTLQAAAVASAASSPPPGEQFRGGVVL